MMGAAHARAATLVAPGRYEIREYPLPDPAPGCALVRMRLSGICGTDKHTYQGYTTQYAGTGAPKEIPFPIIQGHENVGTVAAIGGERAYTDFEGVPLRVGDRVVVGANVICGECYYCRHDFPYYFCERMVDYGNNMTAAEPPHLFGGWSEYLYVVPGSFLVRVPDDLPDEVAVLTEVMAVAVGLDRAKQFSAVPNEAFRFDDTVVVLGVGSLGMCFLMKARMLGAGTCARRACESSASAAKRPPRMDRACASWCGTCSTTRYASSCRTATASATWTPPSGSPSRPTR